MRYQTSASRLRFPLWRMGGWWPVLRSVVGRPFSVRPGSSLVRPGARWTSVFSVSQLSPLDVVRGVPGCTRAAPAAGAGRRRAWRTPVVSLSRAAAVLSDRVLRRGRQVSKTRYTGIRPITAHTRRYKTRHMWNVQHRFLRYTRWASPLGRRARGSLPTSRLPGSRTRRCNTNRRKVDG